MTLHDDKRLARCQCKSTPASAFDKTLYLAVSGAEQPHFAAASVVGPAEPSKVRSSIRETAPVRTWGCRRYGYIPTGGSHQFLILSDMERIARTWTRGAPSEAVASLWHAVEPAWFEGQMSAKC